MKYIYEPQGFVNYQCGASALDAITLLGSWTGSSSSRTRQTLCNLTTSYSQGYAVVGQTTIGVTASTTPVTSSTSSSIGSLSIIKGDPARSSQNQSIASAVTLSEPVSPTSTTSDAPGRRIVCSTFYSAALIAMIALWQ